MRIENINCCNFGMAVKCVPNETEVKNYILKGCSTKKYLQLNDIFNQLSQNRAITNLTLKHNGKRQRLQATVGDNVFVENFFFNKVTILKKALKASKEESQIELIANVLRILSKDDIC